MATRKTGKERKIRVTLDLGQKHYEMLNELEKMTEGCKADVVRRALKDYFMKLASDKPDLISRFHEIL
ncbi:MAG: hypothetical protein ABR875_02435 [Minisyncoccia bacterium]|jgi:hypothetical protein